MPSVFPSLFNTFVLVCVLCALVVSSLALQQSNVITNRVITLEAGVPLLGGFTGYTGDSGDTGEDAI
jgi:hypothetical protein